MHKNEFIQRGILALMANPNAYGHDSNLLRMAPARLIQEAQDMADFVEQEGIAFDTFPYTDSGKAPEEPADKDRIAELNYLIERCKEMIRDCPKEMLDTQDGKDWRDFIERRLVSYTKERDRLMHERTVNH